MSHGFLKDASSYAVALLAVLVALLLRYALDPFMGGHSRLVTLFGAVAVAAWSGGVGPALFATLTGYVVAGYLFGGAPFAGETTAAVLDTILYLLTCLIVAVLGGGTWRAQRRLAAVNQQLRGNQQQLEAEARERAALLLRQQQARLEAENSGRTLRERVEELEKLLELVPVAIYFAHDPECRRVSGNRAAAHLLSSVPPAHSGQTAPLAEYEVTPHHVFLRGRELANHELPIQRAARGEMQGSEEYRIVFDDGHVKYILGSASPLFDEKGRVRGSIAAFVDVSDRKRVEEELARTAEYLRVALGAAGMVAWEWDMASGRMVLSDNAAALYGCEEAVPDSVDEALLWVSEEDRARLQRVMDDAVARRGGYVEEFRFIRRADGEMRWMEVHGRVLCDEDGAPRKISGVMLDIDERKRAEQALLDADRRKDDFLATLAHELRNPLNPVRSAAAIMRLKAPPEPELQWATQVIERQVRQMARLLDDLLDMSRITRDKLELRKERVELASAIDNALETSRPLIAAGGQHLTLSLPPHPVHLNADPTRLAQVFSNLLNNAARYTDNGGRIRVTATLTRDTVRVSVKDTGIGIAAEHMPRLFAMFSQALPALERSQGGLGIGLSLVRALVEMHGGSVSAHSDGPGTGSEFVVTLPLAEDCAARADPLRDRPPPPSAACSILVVDDNIDSADTLAQLLRLLGHRVSLAHDGLEAVERAAAVRPEVVLLDIGLPRLNGYDAARRIRSTPWGQAMCLVAVTGWGQEQDKRRAYRAGFDHHLTKPVELPALRELLAARETARRRNEDAPRALP